MKKLIGLVSCAVLVFGCTKTSTNEEMLKAEQPIAGADAMTHRACASQDVLATQLAADPSLAARMAAIEEQTESFIANGGADSYTSGGIVYLPVVVNVLYRTTAENISQAQIQSQIDVLNKDYSGTNTDINKVPSNFVGVKAGNIPVRFVLDQIIRKATTKTSWTTNNDMKKSTMGGINPTSASTKLNMWVCNMGGGILGYAQFPGGALATDGVVMDNNAFGVTATGPFNLGRTATHEVGHWLNLRHIWGDATCGSDLVTDTPAHTGANGGCPAAGTRSSCSGTPVMMTMNYMDYTDDACMYMFSLGQKSRMNAVFAVGASRRSWAL